MQRTNLLTYLLLTIFLITTGCEKAKENNQPVEDLSNMTLAQIGDTIITVEYFEHEYDKYRLYLEIKETDDSQDSRNLRNTALYRLIDQTMLTAEADRNGIFVSKQELDTELQSLLNQYDKSRLNLALAKIETSFDEWKAGLEKTIKIKKLIDQQVDSRISVDKSEINAFYKKNSKSFRWPERVRALHIMVDNETEASGIRKKLLAGGDFATIAKEHSLSHDASTGGDLGYFGKGQMPPEFEEAAFSLKTGQISDIIESQYGFHIFKLVKKERSRGMKLAEAQPRITRLLFEQKREKEFSNWIEHIRSQTKIAINRELLKPQ